MFRSAVAGRLLATTRSIGGARAFSSTPAAQVAAEVNSIGVIGAGQMVKITDFIAALLYNWYAFVANA